MNEEKRIAADKLRKDMRRGRTLKVLSVRWAGRMTTEWWVEILDYVELIEYLQTFYQVFYSPVCIACYERLHEGRHGNSPLLTLDRQQGHKSIHRVTGSFERCIDPIFKEMAAAKSKEWVKKGERDGI